MDILAKMMEETCKQVQADMETVPLVELKEMVSNARSPRKVIPALRDGGSALKIIGEIKRCSPHQGYIADIPDVAKLARAYEDGGAAMISVVADQKFHCGGMQDLIDVCRAVSIPVLRKDFILHPYQVHQSRVAGADAVLLAVNTMEEIALISLIERTKSLGMTPVVQVHSRLEALVAVEAGAEIITVNALNQHTMEVEMDNFAEIVDVIPDKVIAVAESGVKGPHDVFRYARDGADAVLVGKALVESEDPRSLIKDMVSAGSHPALAQERQDRIRPSYGV